MLLVPALFVAVALAQAPEKEQSTPPTPAAPAAVPAVALSDRAASDAIAQWKRVSAKAPLAERMAALEALSKGSHASLVPVLEKLVRGDGAMSIRKKAAEALAWQPEKNAYGAVVGLLGDGNLGKLPELVEPLVVALGRTGYKAKDWDRLERLFRAGYDGKRIGMQRAIIVLAGEQKEKQALRLLLENFDEPAPKDVHAASNPPAEYWEARWKAWKAWRDEVKTAVQKITGQKFASEQEARAWLRTNGAKIGVKGF